MKYQHSLSEKDRKAAAANRLLDEFMDPIVQFADRDPKQVAIKESIIQFIVDASMPLSVVENAAFRKIIHKCQPKFKHISR